MGQIGDKEISQLKINGKVGLVGSDGKVIVPHICEDIKISPYGNLHPFLKDGRWGYIDNEGYVIMENKMAKFRSIKD